MQISEFHPQIGSPIASTTPEEEKSAALFQTNKTTLFDAFHNLGITRICVSYEGSDDEGDLETTEYMRSEEQIEPPAIEIPYLHEHRDLPEQMDLDSFLHQITLDFILKLHSGWEDNMGAYGTVEFSVADRTIKLTHHARFTEYETTETDL